MVLAHRWAALRLALARLAAIADATRSQASRRCRRAVRALERRGRGLRRAARANPNPHPNPNPNPKPNPNPNPNQVRLATGFRDDAFERSVGKYVRANHVQTAPDFRRSWKKVPSPVHPTPTPTPTPSPTP